MEKIKHHNFPVTIENLKGTYKSFGDDDTKYPLKGITYPVDYGYIKGYVGEDGDPLDVFVGTGEVSGFIRVWRLDVPSETKIFLDVTPTELDAIVGAFKPVLVEYECFQSSA
ncbi:MAG: inorganic diphosphatase, partial [Patescibacteria group bacterium]